MLLLLTDYSGCQGKIKKYKIKEQRLKKQLKGDVRISKLLYGLINKKCKLVSEESFKYYPKNTIECIILEVDDDWVKFKFIDKKGVEEIQAIRVELIDKIKFL